MIWTLLFSCSRHSSSLDTKTYPWFTTPVTLDTSPEGTTTTPCGNRVLRTFPDEGEDLFYYRGLIEASLAWEDPDAELQLFDSAGALWPGESELTSAGVRFVQSPLQPHASYTAELTYECGVERWSFETSGYGLPVEVDLVDRTYAINLAGGRWISPPGSDQALADLLAPFELLAMVRGFSPGPPETMQLLVAPGFQGHQFACAPSTYFSGIYWEDPYFELSESYVTLEGGSFGLNLKDFELTGAFAPDGSAIGGVTLAGTLDTRRMGPDLGLGSDPGATCALLYALGVSCGPCLTGEPWCLDLFVADVPSTAVDFYLREISAEDVATNPECDG